MSSFEDMSSDEEIETPPADGISCVQLVVGNMKFEQFEVWIVEDFESGKRQEQ